MKYRLLRLAIAPTVIVILTVLLYFFLYTSDGLNLVLQHLQKATPGSLSIKDASGNLAGEIAIGELSWSNNKISITLHNVKLNWQIFALLKREFKVNELTATDVAINTSKQTDKQKRGLPVLKLKLPISLNLANIKLTNINITQDNNKPRHIDNVNLNLTTTRTKVTSIDFQLLAPKAKINIIGSFAEHDLITWNVEINDLATLLANANGTIISAGSLTKKDSYQLLQSQLQIKNLQMNNVKVAALNSNINLKIAENSKSEFTLEAYNILLNKYSIANLKLIGNITIVSLARDNPQVKLNLRLLPTTISLPTGYQTHVLKLSGGDIEANISSHGIDSNLQITPQNQQPLQATMSISKDKKIIGEVKWHTKEISSLEMFMPQLMEAKGELDTDLKLGGSLSQPTVLGNLQLRNAEAYIPSLNIRLREINLAAELTPDYINYSATAKSGKGNLTINCKTDLTSDNFPTTAIIKGNEFLAIDNGSYVFYVTPNLTIKYDKQAINIGGDIHVPEASIKPQDLSTTQSLPQEVVFVGDKHKEQFGFADIPVNSNITVTTGDDVYLNIMGLTGYIYGKLQIMDAPLKPTTATGMLSIRKGRYKAYGKTLYINYGTMNFIGGPIDNPSINIDASRTIKTASTTSAFDIGGNNVTVGVRLSGPLHHLRTSFYSSAGLANSDILSYLVLGQSVSEANEQGSNTQLLMQAASTLNFGGSGGLTSITETLRKKLGFAQLGLESGETIEPASGDMVSNTSFVLGKYLSPKLYISYSYGLLDPVSTFRVRYRLSKKWYIQSETSTLGNGLDILYSYERK